MNYNTKWRLWYKIHLYIVINYSLFNDDIMMISRKNAMFSLKEDRYTSERDVFVLI